MAQSTTDGAIGGTIKDPNGAVVPNATVSVKNEETNKEASATTDSEGRFRVTALQPGNYTVSINASGFGAFNQSKIVVEVGRITELDIPLSVGGVGGDQVEVTGEAPVINTSQQDFSTNINQTSINELPINGRRWSNFALLTPAASLDGTFGLISFRGISGLLNNSTVDGGDNNQAFFAEERGRTRISYVISQAAVREFQVNTSNYSAEYGRAAGGVINAVTKSGTNEFHGSAFYYYRNNRFGARNPLAVRTIFTPGQPNQVIGIKPVDVRHQFGGAIGGPIVKDKLFFFFSYDQQERNFPGLAVFNNAGFLNTANRAQLTTALGVQVPGQPVGTLGRGLTNAQVDASLSFLNSLTGEVPRQGDQILILPKIDWNINDSNSFSINYNRLRWESPAGIQTQATNTRARDNFGDDFVDVDTVNARLNSTITPTILNEVRFQWSRDLETQFSQPPFAGEPTNGPGGRSPQVFIQNGFSFGKPEFLERAAFPDEKRIQVADSMTVTRGNHTFKFGGDFNRVKEKIQNLRFEGGEFNYTGNNGINDFIIDYTNFRVGLPPATNCITVATRFVGRCYGGNFNQGFGILGTTFNTSDVNLFFQDDIRVSPRLTVNLGMRYELQLNPDQGNANPLLPQTGNMPNDKNNFGPRVGLAYDIFGDGKTSIRAGYGIYYGRIINSTIYSALVNTGVGIDRGQRQVQLSGATGPIFPNLLAAGVLLPPAVQHFAPNFANPQIHQYDVILEREIAKNTVLSVSYIGSLGRRLPTFVDTNLPAQNVLKNFTVVGGPFDGQSFAIPVSGPVLLRPNTAFAQITEIRSNIKSEYNAFVAQFNRRFTDGLQFQINYTFSKSTDTGQTSQTFTANNVPFNASDLNPETATSNLDTPQKITASAVWTPDFFGDDGDSKVGRAIFNGFTISPVFYAFSGRPYSGTVVVTNAPSGALVGPALTSVNLTGGANRFPLTARNSFRQPEIINMDLRVSRRFNLGETMNLEVLVEGFNIFNRTQVTNVNTTFYNLNFGTGVFTFNGLTNTNFNPFQNISETGATLFRERQVQFAVRFEF
ncbi:MAG: carboxypeptidase regulatory-like domain-containing protein [Pyrinomonadaceae bacterium]|nr:carboxypeptidase regulatory-like domain-containing protein [Pyrinomonadaceae bacterium]